MIRALRDRWRRPPRRYRRPALALALTCAGAFAARPATAADGPSLPQVSQSSPRTDRVSDKELRGRVAAAVKDRATPDTTPRRHPSSSAAPRRRSPPRRRWCSSPLRQLGRRRLLLRRHPRRPNKVLTAAHCVAGLDWVKNGAVLAGAAGLLDDTSGTVSQACTRQWNHRTTTPRPSNDIAVLTLDRPLDQQWQRLVAAGDSASYKAGNSATISLRP